MNLKTQRISKTLKTAVAAIALIAGAAVAAPAAHAEASASHAFLHVNRDRAALTAAETQNRTVHAYSMYHMGSGKWAETNVDVSLRAHQLFVHSRVFCTDDVFGFTGRAVIVLYQNGAPIAAYAGEPIGVSAKHFAGHDRSKFYTIDVPDDVLRDADQIVVFAVDGRNGKAVDDFLASAQNIVDKTKPIIQSAGSAVAALYPTATPASERFTPRNAGR